MTRIPIKHVIENKNGIHINCDQSADCVPEENLEKSGAFKTKVEKLAIQPSKLLKKAQENAEPVGWVSVRLPKAILFPAFLIDQIRNPNAPKGTIMAFNVNKCLTLWGGIHKNGNSQAQNIKKHINSYVVEFGDPK